MSDVVPPNNPTAEKSLLALILTDNAILDDPDCQLRAPEFYIPSHATIYRTAREHRAAGKVFDLTTAPDCLADHPDAASILADIGTAGMTAAVRHHASDYAASIRDAARRRQIIERASNLVATAYDGRDESELQAAIASIGDDLDSGGRGLALMDSAAFDDADFEIEYLVENILVRGQPGAIAGPMKGAKTLSSIALAVHGATGTPLFGNERFAIPQPFRTAVFSMESGGATLRAVARSICHSLDCRLSDLAEMLHWNLDSIRVDDARVLSMLRREIEKREIDLVIIDPLYLALNVDDDSQSNMFRMGARLHGITKLTRDTGAALILNHHANKRRDKPHEPMKLNELNGAGVGEYIRQWILVSRRSEYDPESKGHHELWMVSGGAEHGGTYALDIDEYGPSGERRQWQTEARPASVAIADKREAEQAAKRADQEAKQAEAKEDARKIYAPKVIRCLRLKANRDGASFSKIREFVGCTQKALRMAIDYLLETGQVMECTFTAKNHQPYGGYRLTGESHSEPLGTTRNPLESPVHSEC